MSTPKSTAAAYALGPSVPDEAMTYIHAYGDSRADEDGLSGLRLAEAILALRRWAGTLTSAATTAQAEPAAPGLLTAARIVAAATPEQLPAALDALRDHLSAEPAAQDGARPLAGYDGVTAFHGLNGCDAHLAAQGAAQPEPQARHAVALTAERVIHIWDTHVGEPTKCRPLTPTDAANFGRAIERASWAANGLTQPKE